MVELFVRESGRWTESDKKAVVRFIKENPSEKQAVFRKYYLSEEEVERWASLIKNNMTLRVTKIQYVRDAERNKKNTVCFD